MANTFIEKMELEGAFFDTSQFNLTDKMLGEGSFGRVYIVICTKDGNKYAAKIIDPKNLKNGKDQMMLIRESEILHKLHHPAIVKFYGINFHSFNDSTKLEPTILTEYLTNVSLKEILDAEKKSIANKDWTPTKKYICLLGISDAMRYLHEQQIIHRDIKPQNILIDSNYYPRVSDFGLSRCFSEKFTESMQLSMTRGVGSPLYMAPELYDDDDDDYDKSKHKYGPSIDVYAFAILAYEIVTGLEPFSKNGKQIGLLQLTKKLTKGERPEFNEGVTKKMKKLISRCWSNDPKDRPTFKEIFEKLSSDFSYFYEDVDEEEVNAYLEDLKEARNEEAKSKGNKEEEKQKSNAKEDSNSVILADFLIDKKIGKGGFGVVYQAKLYKEDNQEISCAVKYAHDFDEYNSLKLFFNEVQNQAPLKHEAVLPLIGFYTPTSGEDKYAIITPYMPNGDLHNLIEKVKKRNAPPNYETIRAINIFGIAAGMAYIHQHDAFRLDLKPYNVVLDENYHPKICDFGLSIHLKLGSDMESEQAGSFYYMSPEAFKEERYSHKADVYSYSIILYELFTLPDPYPHDMSQFKIIEKVLKGERPKINREIPPIYANLIRRSWADDPGARPSFIEIVKDFLDRKEEYFDFSIINEDEFNHYVNTVIKDLYLD